MYNKTLEKLLQSVFETDYKSVVNTLENRFAVDELIENGDDEYSIEMSIPGLTKEDLKIITTKDVLSISYDSENVGKNKFVSPFKRKFVLPKNVNHNDISAKIENGICKIRIPKDKEKSGERLIPIE
jgi:HSP20 family protein